MTPGPYTVNLARLDEIAFRIEGFAAYLAECLEELDRRVAIMHASSWSGTAAAAHAQAHKDWAAGATEFNQGLIDVRTAVRKAHERYASAATVTRNMARGNG
jgi:WXG100 family type VII secretion target